MSSDINSSQTTDRKKILVVDDEESIRMLMVALFGKDYDVITKSDGQDALDFLSKGNRPDLILLDMEMPNMNGRVFVRRVKFDPRYGKIPIIFVTSVDNPLITNTFTNMGVVGFILKPFKPEELITRVNNFFNVYHS
jgi:Response regulator containing a CheY-like receiver domain and an HD-GYP domain